MCAYRVFAIRFMGRSGGEERPLCVWSMCIPVLGRNNSFKRVNIPAILRVWCSGLLKSRLRTRTWWAERKPGLYALFLKGQWHQGIFSLVKGTLCKHFNISTGAFQGHQGNDQVCLIYAFPQKSFYIFLAKMKDSEGLWSAKAQITIVYHQGPIS